MQLTVPAITAVIGAAVLAATPSPSPTVHARHVARPAGSISFSLSNPDWITAVATGILALFAIVTAVFAILAFRKQSKEVALLQQQLTDQQMFNRKQSGVLELQAKDLQASLEARKQAAMQWRWEYASTIVAWLGERMTTGDGRILMIGNVKNTGSRPVRDLSVQWYQDGKAISEPEPLSACFMPDASMRFEQNVAGELGPAFKAGRLKAIVEFRTVGDDRWRAGTDGGLASRLYKDAEWAVPPWQLAGSREPEKSGESHEGPGS